MYLACREGKTRLVEILKSKKVYFSYETFLKNNLKDVIKQKNLVKSTNVINMNDNSVENFNSKQYLNYENGAEARRENRNLSNNDCIIKLNKKDSIFIQADKKNNNSSVKDKYKEFELNKNSQFEQSNDKFLDVSVLKNSKLSLKSKILKNESSNVYILNNKSNKTQKYDTIILDENKSGVQNLVNNSEKREYNDMFNNYKKDNKLLECFKFEESMIPSVFDDGLIIPKEDDFKYLKIREELSQNDETVKIERKGKLNKIKHIKEEKDDKNQIIFSNQPPLIRLNSSINRIFQEPVLMKEDQIIDYFDKITLTYVRMKSTSPKFEDSFIKNSECENSLMVTCRHGYIKILKIIISSKEYSKKDYIELIKLYIKGKAYIGKSCFKLLISQLTFNEKIQIYFTFILNCKCMN